MKKAAKRSSKKSEKLLEMDPTFALIANAFANDPHVTCGKMMASMGLKVNGKIFAMLVKRKLVVKLPKDRVNALAQSGTGTYFDPGHGRLMKQWIAVTDRKAPWLQLAKEAYRFVTSGKP